MNKDTLKDSSTLLRFMISVKNQNNDCKIGTIYDTFDVGSIDLQNLVNELSAQGYVWQTSTNNIHILPKGISAYGSPARSFWTRFQKPISYVFAYIMGILSTVIAELIILAIT